MVQDMGTTFNVKGDRRENSEMTLEQVYYPLTTASRRARPLCETFCSSLYFGCLWRPLMSASLVVLDGLRSQTR
jgi:hypothetical protein